MLATRPLLARGFLARSMDELKRRSSIAWNLEAVKGPQGPRPLYSFNNQESVRDCVIMADTLIGGFSKSNFELVSSPNKVAPSRNTASQTSTSNETPSSSSLHPTSYAIFHGSISTALPPDRPNIERTGYAGFRTPDQGVTLFGRAVWDIDPYVYLAMRVKSDGRAYLVNIQTEGVEPTDLHQHRLFAKRPGEWETVIIRWNEFVRTNHGFVIEPQTELLRQRVRTFGISLTDRVEGPFELCIERIWATNRLSDGDTLLGSSHSHLKNRKGESVQWQ